MKKLFKILGIIIISIIVLPFIIGLVVVIFEDKQAPVETDTSKSDFEEISAKLDVSDNQKDFDAYFKEIEKIANGSSADTTEARNYIKHREDHESYMQLRALDKWVERAKEEYPKQFSKWDGSNSYLVKALKEAMNDPDSFKHDETRWEYGSGYKYISVYMKYRGKNAYGAYVRGAIKAKIDINGNILETEQS